MALGRGLSELLGEVENAYEQNSAKSNKDIIDLDVDLIKVNPYQPRKIFDESKLEELSNSIKQHGLMQPIIVINSDDGYILVAGERRLRAVKLIAQETIKAIVADIDENKLREYALLENIQRDDLNILEVAYSYAGLINDYNMTHEELASVVSKSRSSITNILRLLTLSKFTQQMITLDKITLGHAKVIMGLNEDEQKTIVDSIIGQKLSVRETETLVRNLKDKKETPSKKNKNKEKFDFSPLQNIIEKFKEDKLNIKVSADSIKINIKSQKDIEKLLHYFSLK
jgi:ParB family chromosome partitioning protein